MKKLSKKQALTVGAIALLLVGGGTVVGVINHNNDVHAQQVAKAKAHEDKVKADKKARAEKEAKEKEISQQKQVASLLSTATANPSDESIKAVNNAIAKLTDQKEKAKDTDLVKGLNARLVLIKKAQSAVKDYQAHATDANKQKVAQEAINALKDKNDEDVKAQLQKLFDESNRQAQEAAKSAQATQKASSAKQESNKSEDNNTKNNNSSVATNNDSYSSANSNVESSNNTYTPSTPNTGSGSNTSSNANAGNSNSNSNSGNSTPSNGGGNNNTGGNANNGNNNTGGNTNNGGNTPPPAQQVWQGWVKNGAGVVVASQNFSDWQSATSWASSWADSHYASLIINGKMGSFGANQIS